jgi:hypothetical protein
MGCLLVLVAWISPRFALAILYFFTNRLTIAFSSGWEGILGFILLPYTTLFYALVYAPVQGVRGFGWVIVGAGVLLDLSTFGSGGRRARRRSKRAPVEP